MRQILQISPLLFSFACAHAGTLIIPTDGVLTPPSQRVDDTTLSLSEIGGYHLYFADHDDDGTECATDVDQAFPAPLPTTIKLTVPAGIYCPRVTAYDTDGLESAFLVLPRIEVKNAPPKPPTVTATTSAIQR